MASGEDRSRSLRMFAGTVGMVLLLLLPASAHAATHTVTFDDLYLGTSVTTQYLNDGGSQQGVAFGENADGTSAGELPVVTTDSSGTNQVGDVCACNGEFHTVDVWGRFPFLKHTVSMAVGANGSGGSLQLELDAFDASGAQIDSSLATVTPGAPPVTMSLSSPSGDIAFFELLPNPHIDAPPHVYIDDLTYDVPVSPPPPRYAIHWTGPVWAGADFGTPTGTSISTTVAVTRVNGSSGLLSFFANNLPSGVTASFSPSAPTTASKVTVTFKVGANAGSVTDHTVTIVAAAANPTTSGASPQTTNIPLTVLSRYDAQVRGIEVVQSVQSLLFPSLATNAVEKSSLPQLPERDLSHPSAAVPYTGVKLAAGGTTVARVWASIATPAGLELPGIPLALHGFDAFGHELPGSPLVGGEMTLEPNSRPFVTWNDMVNPQGSWDFVLPESWTEHGLLKLKATLLPSQYFQANTQAECDQPICAADDSFTLGLIPFTQTNAVSLTLVAMQNGPNDTLAPPGTVFGPAESLTPTFDGGLEYDHASYAGTVDISQIAATENQCNADAKKISDPGDRKAALTDCSDDANDDVLSAEEDWADEHGHGRVTIGVNNGTARGVTVGSIGNIFRPHPDAVVDTARPLTSVAHELFHALGRSHASDCNDGGGDDWPPDQEGWIHGIGFDRNGRGGLGLFGTIAPPVPLPAKPGSVFGTPGAAFDFMSYCAAIRPDFNSWVSDRGWNETLQYLHDHKGTDAADVGSSAAAGPTVHVIGFARTDGIHITNITPELDGPAARPAVGSGASAFTLTVKNSSGHVLASAPMQAIGTHNDPGGPVVALDSSLRVPGAAADAGVGAAAAASVPASISISSPGMPTATVRRSKHVPVVRVLSPGPRTTVGRGRFVTVRYRAHDADGGTLTAKVQYSFDGGRTFNTLWAGPARGRVRIPSLLLSGSHNARIRVRVSDGFNEGRATSGRFTAIGRAPVVKILSPRVGTKVAADGVLSLAGQAYDDRGHLVSARHLVWYAGARRVGRGARLTLSGFTPGRLRLRLLARVRGRLGTARVTVNVTRAVPRILALKTPTHISIHATSLSIRLAATVPARLSAGGRHFSVSRSITTFKIPVKPGKGQLTLRLTLSAAGLHSTTRLLLPRH